MAPTSPSYQPQSRSLADAACSPTQPPPPRTYFWRAARWPESSRSPVSGVELVLLKTIALKRARFSSVNAAASSVASTSKPFSLPSFLIASMPAGIESWAKFVTLEKTSTRYEAAAWARGGAARPSPTTRATSARRTVQGEPLCGLHAAVLASRRGRGARGRTMSPGRYGCGGTRRTHGAPLAVGRWPTRACGECCGNAGTPGSRSLESAFPMASLSVGSERRGSMGRGGVRGAEGAPRIAGEPAAVAPRGAGGGCLTGERVTAAVEPVKRAVDRGGRWSG